MTIKNAPDWADEKAKELANKIHTDGILRQGDSVETIAAALRQAREEEMGRCIKILEDSIKQENGYLVCSKTPPELIKAIRFGITND